MDPKDLSLLLQLLRTHPSLGGTVYSDTPGREQTMPFQIPGATRQDFSNGPEAMPQMPMDHRMLLEKMLMEKRIQDMTRQQRTNRDLFKMNEQDQFNQPGMQWDMIPGTGLGRYM